MGEVKRTGRPVIRAKTPTPVESQQKAGATPAPPPPATKAAGWGPKPGAGQAWKREAIETRPSAPAPVTEETQRTLSDARQRTELATTASQVNDISVTAGNEGDICGGAALMNALVLGSATPEAARANAAALRQAADTHQAYRALPPGTRPGIDAALGHLAQGTLSENDLNALQQLGYALGRSVDETVLKDPKATPGLNPAQMGAVVAQLKANGAQLDESTRFVELKGARDTAGHWVVQTNGALANTLESVNATAEKLSPGAATFDSDVRVKGDAVQVRTRGGGLAARLPPGKAYVMTLDPNKAPSHALLRNTLRDEVRAQFNRAVKAGPQSMVKLGTPVPGQK